MQKPVDKCQLALILLTVVVVFIAARASCKPQQPQQTSQQQQQQQQQQFDRLRDRKQQQQVDDQANHLSRTSPSSSLSSTTASSISLISENQANGQFQCPEQFGYYVDARDCSKYYVCVFGEVLHESCTGGLRFSRELQTCDWPRNVQCPTSSSTSSTTTASTSSTISPNFSTSLTSSTTPATTTTSASSASSSSTTSASSSSSHQEQQDGRPSLKNSAAMVFADEGSDPQQPSFDEAVSPVITPDGAIHLHDGSGGTFSLQAQPNQHHQQQQPPPPVASGSSNNLPGSVDVFVKPLLATNPNQARSRQVTSQQQIKPQTDAGLSQSQNQQHQSRNNQFYPSSTSAAAAAVASSSSSSNGDNQPPSANNEEEPEDNGSNNSESSSDTAASSDDDTSIGAQADQELANEQAGTSDSGGNSAERVLNSSASDQTDLPSTLTTPGQLQLQQQQQRQQQSGASYIPPVIATAPNIARQGANLNNQRQSSQLLSVNNRQIDARNSFRPILVSSSAAQQASSTRGNLFAGAETFLDKGPGAGTGGDGDDDTNPMSEGEDADGGDSPPPPPQLVSSSRQDHQLDELNNNRQLLASSNSGSVRSSGGSQQQARFRQQQPPQPSNNIIMNNMNNNQQSLMRHNQSTFTTAPNFNNLNPLNQNNNNNNNNNNLLAQQQQNNRQSRMSMQNQQQPNNFQTNFQPTNRFLQQPSSTNTNNNNNHHVNNFMNESKLIRLQQASQFEPLPPVDLPTTTMAAALTPLNSNSFHHPKQFSPSNSQQLSPLQRSQSVLFSQQPFGLIADSNGAGQANNNNQRQQQQQLNSAFNQFGAAEPALLANQQSPSSLLQQQRRPRPPKREQIPAGQPTSNSGRRGNGPAGQPLTSTTTATRNQLFPEPDEMTSRPPIGITSSTMANFQPTPSTLAGSSVGGFSSVATEAGVGSTFSLFNGDADEEPPAPVSQSSPPTATSRFQAQSTRSREPTDTTGTTFGAPLVTTELTPTTRARGFAGTSVGSALDSAGRDQQVGQRTGQGQQRQPKLFNADQLQQQQQPPTHSLAANVNGLLASQAAGQQQVVAQQAAGQLQTNSIPNHHLNPTMATTTAAAAISTTATSSSSSVGGGGNTNQEEQDPQLVANRYLNSAMEAGQPFGAVDYDFEILNENSTDRRNPPSRAANGTADQQQPGSNLNGQRQRQGSPTGAGAIELPTSTGRGVSENGSGDDDEDDTIEPARALTGNQRAPNQQPTATGGRPMRGGASSAQRQSVQQQAPAATQTTKKPRPTNKKIQVNHEQALANNRASMEPAKRPESLFATPVPLQTASKCDTRQCRLPDCKCGDTLIPGGLEAKQVPQVVLLTFDDAVNDLNWEIYEELFTGRTNPNGCPILATFYVSHEWTDYGQVQTLYSRGHEMASHSITHSFGEKFSKHQWFKEVNGQREILNLYGGVKMNDVRGMRAPFLQIGGNKMFEMLYDANFTYDSSMPIFDNLPPLWPYTLDYQLAHECMITPCPTKSFPGVWEVGMTMWVDLRGGRCSMGDACTNPGDEDGVYEMLMKNFNRHYKSNRAPFGLFYHSAWFNTVHHRRGFLRFLAQVNSLPDVFFTTNWQALQWMRNPTPLSEINQFDPWQCPAKNDRPPPCYHPSVCNVKSEHGTRFMKTCQPCPANQQYPWVGSTGFKSKQQQNSGSGR